MVLRAVPLLMGCGALFVVNGVANGWVDAYNVLLGITSPADVPAQWCSWPLSLTGWALLPAFIGGMVGYIVTAQINRHRTRDLDEILAELRTLTGPFDSERR
ncbi:DUF6313 family protein [Streptomyces sp. CA-250714]|uniref:DUF6313 family protein n=1 Tax=Streptomyces sp. CA-250714 TaxID=3240060 RepID=UPI003D8A4D09